MKQCRNCGLEKSLNEYPKHKTTKDGYDTLCKVCTNEYAKQRRLKNLDKERERYSRYKENNQRDRLLNPITEKTCNICCETKNISEFSIHQTNKDGYNNKCKNCVNSYSKNYRSKNIEKELIRSKSYYENNKDKKKKYVELNKGKISERNKKYRKENFEKRSQKQKEYYLNNKDLIKQRNKEYYKKRISIDPLFKLKKEIQLLIRDAFRRKDLSKDNQRTTNILGCSVEEFKLYLESKFESWMTWDNKGLYNGELNYGWDIDHIIPISSAKTKEELIKLNHYTNLQPLCGKINRDIKRAN
jgi:hypothetical protein